MPTFSVGQISVCNLYGGLCVAVVNVWRYDIVKLQLHTIKRFDFKFSFPKSGKKMICCILFIHLKISMYPKIQKSMFNIIRKMISTLISFYQKISANGKRLKALFSKIKKWKRHIFYLKGNLFSQRNLWARARVK